MTCLPHERVPKSFLTLLRHELKFTCPIFPSVRLLYDLESKQTDDVDGGALDSALRHAN